MNGMDNDNTNVQNGQHVVIQNRSEPNTNRSERNQNSSEPFGTNTQNVPNRAEQNTNRSEDVPNETPEQHRTAPNCSEEHTEYTITVREAARIFEKAGIPRTERAITNWCNQNARGITRLAACYKEAERKYYVTPQSIEQAIREEKQKSQHGQHTESLFSAEAEDLSEHVRNEKQGDSEDVPNGSEPNTNRSERVRNSSERNEQNVPNEPVREQVTDTSKDELSQEEETRLKELQMENYELKVQLEGQKHLIRKFDELTDKERERHGKETMALVDRLTDARYQIGSLEEKLLQIEAPKGATHEAEVADVENKAPQEERSSGEWQTVG
jgi:hypothetical protein